MTIAGAKFLLEGARLACLGAVIVAAPVGAFAQKVTANSFSYDGGMPDSIKNGSVYSAWNVKSSREVLKPGLKLLFFGRATGCGQDAEDGPTVNSGNPQVNNSKSLTGVPFDERAMSWSPSGDMPACDKDAKKSVGDSFAIVASEAEKGGIGLYSYTGRLDNGRDPFLTPHEASGRGGNGANPHIQSSFAVFRFDAGGERRIAPWAGAAGSSDPTVEFKSVQSVARVVVAKTGKVPTQAKQQIMMTVFNPACRKAPGGAKRPCQIQYLFNSAIVRSGVTDWNQVAWFKNARAWFDVGQAGQPIVSGPIPASGQVVGDASTGLALYGSSGSPTLHGEFKDETFGITVAFSQVKNALKLMTAGRSKKAVQSISDSDIAEEFGEGWNVPGEWILLSISFGQEVYNEFREQRAFMGGNLRSVSVRAIEK